ncbi:hypothetical protein UFOVP314_28 [uncultured Caudovirales phage]|uniref:Uncharacterized protein n=1 Tax=uncultured Caudovirales phage TaxID=2100421 RepID=A0A6J5LYN2_9CAUD|nr:hypothetical protein UFOVP314_28 [uncultured Caudovirales phage]
MTGRLTPDQVLAQAVSDLPEGAYVTGAVVIATYVLPGEDDDDDRGPYLAWRTDQVAGRWAHLGMVETVAADMRADLTRRSDDED